MIALYDHIIALIITGIIVLLLLSVKERAHQSQIERSLMYNAKKQTLEIAGTLERDLMNAGYETSPFEAAVLEYNTTAEGLTDTLQFWGVGASGNRTRIAYGVTEEDSVTADGETMTLYELRRWERQGGQFVRAGGAAPTLTRFRIDLLDEKNNSVTDPEDARRFKIRFANTVHAYSNTDGYLKGYRQLHWAVTVGSTNLKPRW